MDCIDSPTFYVITMYHCLSVCLSVCLSFCWPDTFLFIFTLNWIAMLGIEYFGNLEHYCFKKNDLSQIFSVDL